MSFPTFNPPPPNLELKSDEIHVWCTSLDHKELHLQMLSQTLSSDERMRAKRFYFERDRKHFIACRGILRAILGRYLNVEPTKLQFHYGKHGKPVLSDTSGEEIIHFNLSRSGGLALYAFSKTHKIGVDIECVRDVTEMEQIVERFFSAKENKVFHSLPHNRKKESFFNCWTRKESFVKARGDGLSFPLDNFDVSLAPGESARLLRIDGDSTAASRWFIQDLKPAPDYTAALAVEGRSCQLRHWQWPG